jgi:uncharacterized protein (TIGR02246 family)
MRTISFALLALMMLACTPPPQEEMAPTRTAQEVQAAFETLRAEWQDLANAGNGAAVADFYTADATVTEPDGVIYKGREAIAAYFEGAFPGASDLVITTTEHFVHGDLVASHGTFSQTVEGPEGPMSMSGMWQTVSVYQPDGSLKIRLHQNMIPAQLGPPM